MGCNPKKKIEKKIDSISKEEQIKNDEHLIMNIFFNSWIEKLYENNNIKIIEAIEYGKISLYELESNSILYIIPETNQRLIYNEINYIISSFKKEFEHKDNIKELNKRIAEKEEMIEFLKNKSETLINNANSLVTLKNEKEKIEPEDLDLSVFYFKYKNTFIDWINNRKDLTRNNSRRTHITGCRIIFEEKKLKTARDFEEYFDALTKKNRTNNAFRTFIKFCSKRTYSKTTKPLLTATQSFSINNFIKGGNKDKGNNPKLNRKFRPRTIIENFF